MYQFSILVLLFVTSVTGQDVEESSNAATNVTLGEIVDILTGNLFEIPGNILGFEYDAANEIGSYLLDKLPCRVGLGEDDDACRNVSEIIRSRGFEVEEYDIVTKDGYILNIQRIINPLVDSNYRSKMKPVLLQHELLGSSTDWVINSMHTKPESWPPVEAWTDETSDINALRINDNDNNEDDDDQKHPRSLAFYLANRGYDVFLGNVRGNAYGQRHRTKRRTDPDYWDFSFDEQVDNDLPEMINLVLNTTGHKKMGYVGWSQGTSLMFGLQSDHPEYANVIEPFVALAPIAFIHHIKTPVNFGPTTPIGQSFKLGFGYSDASRELLRRTCGPTRLQKEACRVILFGLSGFNEEGGFGLDRFLTYLHHMPSGTSFKNIAHLGQQILSKKFSRFNWDKQRNLDTYGSVVPPSYNLTAIKSESIVLFTAENDYLANHDDVQLLVSTLKVKPFKWYNLTEEVPKWNHLDFVYHQQAGKLINRRVLEILDHFNAQ